ncbi:MAG: hypothetical protein K8J09_07210 [Planctomycetes bacterium]|nr:hypothetical protein [Planctomycetota bacterium]MCC7398119.1 hypothetical protein [Planctomycetota bacterium]
MNNWFPFFSMLFWFVTKVTALVLMLIAFLGLTTMVATGFHVMTLLVGILLPGAAGFFLLTTDLVYDLGTAEQRRRQALDKK